jgi:hypothetical protein
VLSVSAVSIQNFDGGKDRVRAGAKEFRMKRKLFGISATLAVLLAFGLVLASCGGDDDYDDPSAGTKTLSGTVTADSSLGMVTFSFVVDGSSGKSADFETNISGTGNDAFTLTDDGTNSAGGMVFITTD